MTRPVDEPGDEAFLSRWSRRKTEARAAPVPPEPSPPAEQAATHEQVPLPPVESLAPDADFTPFMAQGVDAGTRNQAMKKLFADPHFNVMDGLDVYIDDYSKPSPLPLEMLKKMDQARRLFLFDDEEKIAKSGGEGVAAAPGPAPESPPEPPSAPPDTEVPPPATGGNNTP